MLTRDLPFRFSRKPLLKGGNRSFDDWWVSIPKIFKVIPYNVGDTRKQTLNNINNIISKLEAELKPTDDEVQWWKETSQIQTEEKEQEKK